MPLKNITFELGQGGLGRPLPGSDYISGMPIYSSTIPTGFSYSVAKAVYSIQDAERYGILGDYSDETKATAVITITSAGTASDTIKLTINEPNINNTVNVVNLGTYTRTTAANTTALVAADIISMINNGQSGYSASGSTSSITISARPGMGIAMNGVNGVVSTTISGTIAATVGQFSGGVASKQAIWHYQISEFFRMQPKGVLWVGFFAVPSGSYDFSEIRLMQNQADGAIRQFGVYNVSATQSATITANLDAIQTICDGLFNDYVPCSVIYSPNLNTFTDLSTLPNLRLRQDPNVSCVIGHDGGALGAFLRLSSGQSVPCLGAALGTVALAKVSEDIAWVSKFNISSGTEDEVIAFGNGDLWSTLYSNSYNMLTQLDNFGYIFLTKKNNVTGSYFNDSHCAVGANSDYAYIENNRTIDKAIRNAYLELAPLICGPLELNADGTLSDVSVATFQNSVKPSLDQMIRDSELSAYAITVDPTQNVQSTSTISVVITLVGIGVARNISVKIGYALAI